MSTLFGPAMRANLDVAMKKRRASCLVTTTSMTSATAKKTAAETELVNIAGS